MERERVKIDVPPKPRGKRQRTFRMIIRSRSSYAGEGVRFERKELISLKIFGNVQRDRERQRGSVTSFTKVEWHCKASIEKHDERTNELLTCRPIMGWAAFIRRKRTFKRWNCKFNFLGKSTAPQPLSTTTNHSLHTLPFPINNRCLLYASKRQLLFPARKSFFRKNCVFRYVYNLSAFEDSMKL